MKINEEWKQPNDKYKCPFCQKEYVRKGISTHIMRKHTNPEKFENSSKNIDMSAVHDARDKKNKKNKTIRIVKYYQNPKYCKCGIILSFQKSGNDFCSRSCANGHVHSDQTKDKISIAVKKRHKTHPLSFLQKGYSTIYWNTCNICNKLFLNKAKRKRCDKKECIEESQRLSGCIAAAANQRRSKNEIELFDYMNSFYSCEHNKPIFNGWDADIIIPSLKLAILWNGPWHYKKMFGSHSIKQVANRDDIKLKEINKKGWKHISVKDCDNKMSPKQAFAQIIEDINCDRHNHTII